MHSVTVAILLLLVSLILILAACDAFTNGIEWLGCRLGLAEVAVTRDLFEQILTRIRLLSPVPT